MAKLYKLLIFRATVVDGFKALRISTSSNFQHREYSNIICDIRGKNDSSNHQLLSLALDFTE